MAAPERNFRAASWRRNAVGAGETLVPGFKCSPARKARTSRRVAAPALRNKRMSN
jgi:hypothetical protein